LTKVPTQEARVHITYREYEMEVDKKRKKRHISLLGDLPEIRVRSSSDNSRVNQFHKERHVFSSKTSTARSPSLDLENIPIDQSRTTCDIFTPRSLSCFPEDLNLRPTSKGRSIQCRFMSCGSENMPLNTMTDIRQKLNNPGRSQSSYPRTLDLLDRGAFTCRGSSTTKGNTVGEL